MYAVVLIKDHDDGFYGNQVPQVLYVDGEGDYIPGRAVYDYLSHAMVVLNRFRNDFPGALYGVVNADDVCSISTTMVVDDAFSDEKIQEDFDYDKEGIYEDEGPGCGNPACELCW